MSNPSKRLDCQRRSRHNPISVEVPDYDASEHSVAFERVQYRRTGVCCQCNAAMYAKADDYGKSNKLYHSISSTEFKSDHGNPTP